MCGFAGYLDSSRGQSNEQLCEQVVSMAQTLRHRGPDDDGAWADAKCGIALGFRRLSVVDLSPQGHQPMHSVSGRYVAVFNGEIYNFRSLRCDLQNRGHIFRGKSDTEVLLAAVEEWGLESSLKQFNGMFAFALWDRWQQELHLVRDRLGEKPLYYGWMGRIFLFGSELKALLAHPCFVPVIEYNSVLGYLRYNYIPAPHSIYKNIHKVPPATLLSLKWSNSSSETRSTSYWSAKESVLLGIAEPFRGSVEDAVSGLDELLRDSVRLRMLADVPVGAFLSGGIDSSTVVSMMQAEGRSAVRTFSIGFQSDDYNEAVSAGRVAKHLGTEHSELYISADEIVRTISKLPHIYDEPFADSSQIPTLLVSQLAREQVTVSLSGDGGDELFGGYNRYYWAPRIWKRVGWLPKSVRRTMAVLLNGLSPRMWEIFFDTVHGSGPKPSRPPHPGDKLQKLAEVMTADDLNHMYLMLVSQRQNPASLLLRSLDETCLQENKELYQNNELCDMTVRMMYLDMVTYLPDDILVKLDRASMAASLEARTPFLDHRVVEFAWRLPFHLKIRSGKGKWILHQVLRKYLPGSLVERPKSGFAIPLHDWLRGPLRDWAESLVDEGRLRREGFFNPMLIRRQWKEHLVGKRNWQNQLWGVLMFEAWLDTQKQVITQN
jgi:asparagine synthase (glutamine-hydrolysing)